MAPTGVACQAIPRWLTTPLAASPASFQPSNPAMATGDTSSPMSLNSITRHLPWQRSGCLLQPTWSAVLVGLPGAVSASGYGKFARRLDWLAYDWGANEQATNRPSRASRGGRRGHGHHAPGQ